MKEKRWPLDAVNKIVHSLYYNHKKPIERLRGYAATRLRGLFQYIQILILI
jgi:hypothetical protein